MSIQTARVIPVKAVLIDPNQLAWVTSCIFLSFFLSCNMTVLNALMYQFFKLNGLALL